MKPRRGLLLAYLGLLGLSTLVRPWVWWNPPPGPDQRIAVLPEQTAEGPVASGDTVRMAYQDRPAERPDAPVIVLLHGSPVASVVFERLAAELHGGYRLIVPDLPGFGRSTLRVEDYSIRAHARYVLDLLDRLGVERAHVAGYSMGSGVGLEMAGLDPDRVASLTFISGIGVQEHELLGDHELNHGLHGLQLVLLWGADNLIPHFGLLDWLPVNVAYARNFYDTDQRPLRAALARWEGPALIMHGEDDGFVPPEAAREHAALMPQSESVWMPGGHGLVFDEAGAVVVAGRLGGFVDRAEAGEAMVRSSADPARVEEALQAAAREDGGGRWTGGRLWRSLVLLALATLASEDLACLAAGVLAAKGVIGYWEATAACFVGIFVGDLLLVVLGRTAGRRSLRAAPLRWIVSAEAVERAERWFERQGAKLIFASRFMPGTRLATYVAAGVLGLPMRKFVGWFALACAVWTPLLVAGGMVAGRGALVWWRNHEGGALLFLVGALIAVRLLLVAVRSLATWRGRRLLVGRWRRLTRWEFWPVWAVYPPVVAYILWLGLRHRCLTLFTVVNPGMGGGGGLVGESKSEILRGLAGAGNRVAEWTLVPAGGPAERMRAVADFVDRHGGYPVVLKPDVGERGSGVVIARDAEEAGRKLTEDDQPLIAQRYVPGAEFGLFYHRLPSAASGELLAITDKRTVGVTGDGVRTLEELILGDGRAVCMARYFMNEYADRLACVPAAGETVPLSRIGTHCRGALFLDGEGLRTPELVAAVDRVSRTYEGFHFGRYDVRTVSKEMLQRGEFTVIELNGLTSEATSIYDPMHSILFGWSMLCRQWRIAFAIAAENRAAGARPLGAGQLWRILQKKEASRP